MVSIKTCHMLTWGFHLLRDPCTHVCQPWPFCDNEKVLLSSEHRAEHLRFVYEFAKGKVEEPCSCTVESCNTTWQPDQPSALGCHQLCYSLVASHTTTILSMVAVGIRTDSELARTAECE
eukprot:6061244-Amphidinium_carterae.1